MTNPPKVTCQDKHCPFHSHLKVRGRVFQGRVVSTKMQKTCVIRREFVSYDNKYKRYSRENSKIPAHIPECMEVMEGDTVKIIECRPISKTVSFVVIDVLQSENE